MSKVPEVTTGSPYIGCFMPAFDNYPFKTNPFEHQRRELEKCSHRQAWAHFWEMGTGKSKVVLDNVGLLYLEGRVDTMIIEAPKGVYANWAYTMIPEHMSAAVPVDVLVYSSYKMLLSSGKRAVEALLDRTGPPRLKVFIVNTEAINAEKVKEILAKLYKQAKGVFYVVDESTCVKTYSSQRSKGTYVWSLKAHYRRILSGTPVTHTPIDLWGQSLVLGKGLLGTTSFYSFRDTFTEQEVEWLYRGGKPIAVKRYMGPKNIKLLLRYLDEFSTRLTKAECLDLPPKLYSKIAVEMTPRQLELYTKLREEALLEFGNQRLEVTHALTLVTKLHQVACGQLKLEDGETVSIENNRVSTLLDLLEPYEGKVIIWASYRQTLIELLKALRETYGEEAVVDYFGDTTDAKRQQAVQDFQDPASKVRFFVGNPQTGGFGLTLTAANLVVYYSNTYRLEPRLQSEDRAHRVGQTSKVTYIDLYSPGTVDERIMTVLRSGKNLADEIMGQPVREWL